MHGAKFRITEVMPNTMQFYGRDSTYRKQISSRVHTFYIPQKPLKLDMQTLKIPETYK